MGAAGSDGPAPRRDGATTNADGPEPGGAAHACAFAFCDSFENVAAGARPDSTLWKGNPMVTVDAVRAFRGKQAMHVPAFMGAQSFMVSPAKGAAFSKKHFGRVFIWIEKSPSLTAAFLHWSTVTALGKTTGGIQMQHHYGGVAYKGKNAAFLWYNGWTPLGHFGPGETGGTMALKTWHCLEWNFDATTSSARFWLNGAEQTAMSYKNSPSTPQLNWASLDTINIGWREFSDTTAPWEVWIDEVAISADERITCER